MLILFSKIFADAPEAYITAKLKHWPGGRATSDSPIDPEGLAATIKNLDSFSVPLFVPDGHLSLSDSKAAAIRKRVQCLFDTLGKVSPLEPGEVLLEDRISLLTEPFAEQPANTPVLRRTTNMAELFYFVDGIQVVDGAVVEVKPTDSEADEEPAAESGKKSTPITSYLPTVPELAKNFGFGIASWAGGMVGAAVFNAVMPGNGVPSYFDDVYQEVTKIVKQEIQKNTIDYMNGKVNGINSWVLNQYTPLKKDPKTTKIELTAALGSQVKVMYNDVLGPLMTDAYAKAGFTVFMLSASMHLALIQEQAMVDPKHKNAKESPSAESVQKNAKDYRNFAISTFNRIIRDRTDYIDIGFTGRFYNGYGWTQA
jgi:hypothetical protein